MDSATEADRGALAIAATLPSLRGLAALAALARHGRQGMAAEALGVSRSALSHRIGDLERELGAVLVTTRGRVSEITEEGVALLAAMGDALERIDAAVAPFQRRRRQLRVTTVNTFAANWLLPRLAAFQQAHPDIEVAVLTTQRALDLEEEDVDCAIRHGRGDWPGLHARLLFRESLVPVAAPSLVLGAPERWPAIRARSRFLDWPRWWRATGQEGEAPATGLTVENRAQALEAALAGAGVALTDRRYVEAPLASERLVVAGPGIDLAEGYYFVRQPARRNRRHIDSFERWLLSRAGAAEATGD